MFGCGAQRADGARTRTPRYARVVSKKKKKDAPRSQRHTPASRQVPRARGVARKIAAKW